MISPVPNQTAPIDQQGMFIREWLRWFASVRDAANSPNVMPYNTVSADYSATNNDYTIEVTLAGKTVTLPDPAVSVGRGYEVYNSSTGEVSVKYLTSNTIVISGTAAFFRSNGKKWIKFW